MFTRTSIVTAGIVAMLAAASLVGATAANADPIEHVMANQAALDALLAAGPQQQDFTSPDAKDAAIAAATGNVLPKAPVTGSSYQYSHSPDAPDLLPGPTAGAKAVISGSYYQYSHSPEAPDLVPDAVVVPRPAPAGDNRVPGKGHGPKTIVVDHRSPDAVDAADPTPAPVGRGAVFASDNASSSSVSAGDLLLGVGVAAGLALLVLLAMRGTKGPRPTVSSR
jgi:hypothetical protein